MVSQFMCRFRPEGDKRVHLDGDRCHIDIEDGSVIFRDRSFMAGWTTNSRVGTEKMGPALVLLTEFLDSFGDGANRPVVCYIELNNFGSDVVCSSQVSRLLRGDGDIRGCD